MAGHRITTSPVPIVSKSKIDEERVIKNKVRRFETKFRI